MRTEEEPGIESLMYCRFCRSRPSTARLVAISKNGFLGWEKAADYIIHRMHDPVLQLILEVAAWGTEGGLRLDQDDNGSGTQRPLAEHRSTSPKESSELVQGKRILGSGGFAKKKSFLIHLLQAMTSKNSESLRIYGRCKRGKRGLFQKLVRHRC